MLWYSKWVTKIICPLLYNHFSLSSSGERMLCCISYYGLSNKSDKEAYLFDYEIDRKEALSLFAKGEFPASCRGCELDEKCGKKSYRQICLDEFPDTVKLIEDNQNPRMEVEFLDLKLGNKCNMACRMCNPQSSSLLEKENKETKMFLENPKELNFNWPSQNKYWNDIKKHSKSLKKINLAGGEPFLIKEALSFLSELVESGQSKSITLFINTNGTIYNQDWIDVLINFKEVNIYFSIDGTEENFEMIRYPMKWSLISKNLVSWSVLAESHPNLLLSFNPTVQLYNLFSLHDILTFLNTLTSFNKVVRLNLLEYPHHFNIKNLSKDGKSQAKLYLLDLISRFPENAIELKAVVTHLEGESSDIELEKFIRISEKFDQVRNQESFSSVAEILRKLVKGDS